LFSRSQPTVTLLARLVCKGNTGTAGYAKIQGGQFDTSAEGGKGTVGGTHTVILNGFDGKAKPDAELPPDVCCEVQHVQEKMPISTPGLETIRIEMPWWRISGPSTGLRLLSRGVRAFARDATQSRTRERQPPVRPPHGTFLPPANGSQMPRRQSNPHAPTRVCNSS
jgi:hypothetical protein